MVTKEDIHEGLVGKGAGYALYLIKIAVAQQDREDGMDVPTDPFLMVSNNDPTVTLPSAAMLAFGGVR